MSEVKVLFDRFMTPPYLKREVIWNCEHELQDDTHLLIKRDQQDYERVFRLPLVKKTENVEDIEISLEVGLEINSSVITAVTK